MKTIYTLKFLLIFITLFVIKSTIAQEKKDLSQNSFKSSNMLGGYNIEGSLHIFIYDNANMQVYRYNNGTWRNQWYGTSSKSIWLYAGGASYSGNGGYFQGNSTILSTVSNTNINANTNELILENNGTIRIKQITFYPPGSNIVNYKWEITNISNTEINDLRFFSGGDTYLCGGDNGAGFWSSNDNTVGVKKTIGNTLQRLYMEGITTPYAYESRTYWAVYMSIIGNALTNTVDEDEGIDNGMALEYRIPSIAPGSTWTIVAVEKFSTSPITNVIVTAPLSGEIAAGSSTDLNFTLKNRTTSPTTVTLTPSINLSGWSAELLTPSSPFNLTGNASQEVIIRVHCPVGTTMGTNAKVTLNAINANGTASDYCNIMVSDIPAITEQPSSFVTCENQTATFKITAINATTYQWQEFGTSWRNLTDTGIYSGTNTSTLNITNVLDSMNNFLYRCYVTNTNGNATSANALLTVNSAPTIINQPLPNTICEGSNTNFSVDATGSDLTYQWQVNAKNGYYNVINGGLYSGATTNNLVIAGSSYAMNEYLYRCIISNNCAINLISNAAILNINRAPYISNQPDESTICEGENTSFSISTLGNGLTYQWQVNNGYGFTNITNGLKYNGTATNTLSIIGATSDMNDYEYLCIVNGSCNPYAISEPATLTVNLLPTIDLGQNRILCKNESVMLDAGPGIDYVWSLAGLSGQIVTINESMIGMGTTDISVVVTNNNNCDGTDTIAITYVICTDINNLNSSSNILIDPNPTSGMVYINFPCLTNEAEIELYNMQGKIVKKIKVNDIIKTQIDMSNLAKGAYNIRIITNSQITNKKLILN